MWDQRYGGESYDHGTAPHDFLVEQCRHIPSGKMLCLAEEGNDVTAVDVSQVGLHFFHFYSPAALSAAAGSPQMRGKIALWSCDVAGSLYATTSRIPDGRPAQGGNDEGQQELKSRTGLAGIHSIETVREIREGEYHHGEGAAVQLLARKPQERENEQS